MRRKMLSIGAAVVACVAAVAIYNLDAITGQMQFNALCEREGGSKFFAQVEPNVGWEVESADEKAFQVPFNFGSVEFVRFRDKQGVSFDVHIKNGPTQWSKGYDITPADNTKQAKYRLTIEQGLLPGDQRMSRTRFAIADIQSGEPVAAHTYFSYSWTKPERVVLSAPTSVSCHAGNEVNLFANSIYRSGKKK